MSKTDNGSLSILDLLPDARRREIFAEALHGQVAKLLVDNPNATLGDFVSRLEKHEYWEGLKELRASQVLMAKDHAPAEGRRVAAGRAPRITGDLVEKVFAYVEKNPGQRSEEIQKGIKGEDSGAVGRALARLRGEKRVKTKGERRSMTYSV